jgi:hypothetical protein
VIALSWVYLGLRSMGMKDINGKEIELGSVLKIAQRSRALYKVIRIRKADSIPVAVRCKNMSGFPSAGDKSQFAIHTYNEPEIVATGTVESNDVISTQQKSEASHLTVKQLMGKPSWMVSNAVVNLFAELEYKLSPENLYCDGEVSPEMAKRQGARLMAMWTALEQYAGVKVDPVF